MNNNLEIIGDIVSFLVVALIFLIVLAITFRITLKKYNVKNNKIKFYGLFLGMNNKSILAFSAITLNYIFLVWCVATFSKLNIYYIFITVFFMMFSDIIVKNYNRIFMDLVYSMINILCIFVTSMLYDYLMNSYQSIYLLIILGLVTIFVFLYFTYIAFKNLNNIVVKEDVLKKKDYKKL